MAWTTPTDRSTGYMVTASDWNIVEDNLTFLASTASVAVGTLQTTSSTTYTDLATVGPTVTLTTGAHALVILTSYITNNTAADISLMSFAVSGATAIAAADTNGAFFQASIAGGQGTLTSCVMVSLTAGSNTFTAKYRVSGGTGSFGSRNITVIPLP